MRSVNNDWEMFIEHEAKLCRQEQEREKHGKYGEISTINSEMKDRKSTRLNSSHT